MKRGSRGSSVLYHLSSSWRLTESSDDDYDLFGGDDAKFKVDNSSLVQLLASGQSFKLAEVSDEDRSLFEKLRSAGVIEPKLITSSSTKIAVVGDEPPFAIDLKGRGRQVKDSDLADYAIVIRHKSTLQQIAVQADELKIPHLLIDISFHHTVSVGPLVMPHETPCISCLYGRISVRWGDERPVSQPSVTEDFQEMVIAIVESEISRLIDGDTSLVGKTASWNLKDREVQHEQLFSVPQCQYCFTDIVNGMIKV